MARKKIREFDAKKLILENYQGILVDESTDLNQLTETWLSEPLIVKPDQLFGKRKKHNLALINANLGQVKQFIQDHLNKEVTIGKAKDQLTHFLIEPFIPHEKEYYLAFKSERDYDIIYFSEEGGIDIEENWDNVKTIKIQTFEEINTSSLNQNETISTFIKDLYQTFKDLHFSYLEINPFTLKEKKIHLLDTVAHIDDCASFLNLWPNLEFPKAFGKKSFPEEELIEKIDQNSGASLKLSILNQEGKIWNILGGGGASIIYLDMITNLGKGDEIANYGESSGNPSTEESYQYAKAILELMIKNNGKILFIVGGIANFTDIRNTFQGFIKALEEYGQKMKENSVQIFIRRGGPHDKEGLQLIKETGEKIGISMQTHGAETSMPKIIEIAKESL